MTGPTKNKSGNNNRRFATHKPKPLTPQEAVPTLIFGPSNNWLEFSKKMALAAGSSYGRLGDFIEQGAYYVPPMPTPDMTITDPSMRDEVLKSEFRERAKEMKKLEVEKPMLYAFIMTKLSLDSEDELKRHNDYNIFNTSKDPLLLWKALESLHLVTTVSKNAAYVLRQAENDFMTCAQGEHESITKFKERFELKLKAYNAALDANNHLSDERAAMVFLDKLNRTPYGQFYANETNIINADPSKVPKTIGDVYQKAKAYVIIGTSTKPNGTPVSFATTAELLLKSNKKKTPRGQQTNNPNNGLHVSKGSSGPTITPNVQELHDSATVPTSNVTTNPHNSTPRNLSRVQCYNCPLFGHFARDCPTQNNDGPINGMSMDGVSYYQPKWYEVGLDSMSQVNILNSRFLVDFLPGDSSFKGLNNQTRKTSYVGSLPLIPGLVCQVCDDCVASVLSLSQVKKLGMKVSYDGREDCFIIHTPNENITFYQRGDLYLADFRDHLTDRALSAMTTKDREQLFDKAMVKMAQEAGKFIRSAGFPSEQTAINLVRSGNINNMPIEVQDVKIFFEIYGTPISAIRGKTTQDHHIFKKDNYDSGLRDQITVQEQISDIMHVAGRKYLISLVTPIQVVLVVPVTSLSREALGRVMQQHRPGDATTH